MILRSDMDRIVIFIRRYYCDSGKTRMSLLRLHDSINWIIGNKNRITQRGLSDNVDKVLEENAPGSIKDEVIIYPLSKKTLEHLE